MEKELTALRPYTRQEFQTALGGGPPSGMSAERYRVSVFDFERSPHIERRGLNEARMIVLSTPREAYPDSDMFLFACLQRVETFLYECFKPEGLGCGGGDERSLMFKSGVRKVARAVAEKLSAPKAGIWAARREALDDSTDTAEVSEHPHQVMSGKKCPECGAHAVIKKDGCSYCTSCGYLGSCG